MPVLPKAAACADSRSNPNTRLSSNKPSEKKPARKYISWIIKAETNAKGGY
jgi:hypothetical protein